jgi:hypothetical protein
VNEDGSSLVPDRLPAKPNETDPPAAMAEFQLRQFASTAAADCVQVVFQIWVIF